MITEDILDCIIDLDVALSQIESAILQQNRTLALNKLRSARAMIEDLRHEECIESNIDIELRMINILK